MNSPCLDFRAVYEAHVDYVWRGLRRLGVPAAELDDATQKVFVVVHRRLREVEPDRPLRPWLMGIAWRVAAGERRRLRRRREWLAEPLVLEARCADTASPEAALLDRERAARVLEALQALSPPRRVVFVMHELDEIPCPAIAEALGVPLNTVYSRLRVARRRFGTAVRALRARKGAT